MALRTCEVFLLQQKKDPDRTRIQSTLQDMVWEGRFDIRMYQGKKIILDGAHNPQKMEHFLKTLITIFPDQKFTFLVACKEDKNLAMLAELLSYAKQCITTEFSCSQDFNVHSSAAIAYTTICTQQNYKNHHHIPDLSDAFASATAMTEENDILVITGSLYLLSLMYTIVNFD